MSRPPDDAAQATRPRKGHRGRHRPRNPRRHRPMPLWQELPLLLIVALCLAVLVRTFLVQAFFIPSASMESTLIEGDRVVVNKIVYDLRDPMRGEVVVFRGPERWAKQETGPAPKDLAARFGRTLGDLVGTARPGEKDFIKRVIGVPGDRVSCCDPQGRIIVNGKPVDEPYVLQNSALDQGGCGARRFAEVLVPPGHIWVMGDHRAVSLDARCQGPVPIANAIGKAMVIVWPKDRVTRLPMPPTWKQWEDNPAAAPTPR